jgi:multiple antibiotic resistance protein
VWRAFARSESSKGEISQNDNRRVPSSAFERAPAIDSERTPLNGPLFQYALTAFVTLLVVVDPFSVVPIFTALTAGSAPSWRRVIVRRAVLIAFGIACFFLVAGRTAMAYLGITVHAFAISGGILLFATALPMLFGHRPGMQAPEVQEKGGVGGDISIFPLAVPLLSGPGAITSILLLTSQAGHDGARLGALALAITGVFAITWLVLRLGERLMAFIGEAGVHIVTRVMGIVLAALAVQFVLNGFTAYYRMVIHS